MPLISPTTAPNTYTIIDEVTSIYAEEVDASRYFKERAIEKTTKPKPDMKKQNEALPEKVAMSEQETIIASLRNEVKIYREAHSTEAARNKDLRTRLQVMEVNSIKKEDFVKEANKFLKLIGSQVKLTGSVNVMHAFMDEVWKKITTSSGDDDEIPD